MYAGADCYNSLDCHLEGGLLGGRAHVVLGGVGEGEGAAVQRHPQHGLVTPRPELQTRHVTGHVTRDTDT